MRGLLGKAVAPAIAVLAFASVTAAQPATHTIAVPFFDEGAAYPADLVVQPDGKILVAGTSPPPFQGFTSFALMRFLPDGTPDPAFGVNGRVVTRFPTPAEARAVAIQPDGRIVVAGHVAVPSIVSCPIYMVVAVARYLPDGTLDSSFSDDGWVVQQAPPPHTCRYNVQDVAISPGGEIFVAALTDGYGEAPRLLRYSTDGVEGTAWTATDLQFVAWQPLAFATAGRVLVLGFSERGQGRLARYTATGALDLSFNGSGVLEGLEGNAVATLPDDRIVVAGNGTLTRLTADGSRDQSFGAAGTIAVQFGPAPAGLLAMASGRDGKIAGAGTMIHPVTQSSDFALVVTDPAGRVLQTATADFGHNDEARAVAFVGNEVIAAGFSRGRRIAWVRLALNTWRPLWSAALDAEWDGDSRADMIVTSGYGEWRIADSSRGFAPPDRYLWGLDTDVPVALDIDGDRRTNLAVYRPANGTWHVVDPWTYRISSYQWGSIVDMPVPGDYDGNGRSELAVYRPYTGEWFIHDVVTGHVTHRLLGGRNETPVAADYDGDGATDPAVYNTITGVWTVLNLRTSTISQYQWGMFGDLPVPRDYAGTGRLQIAIFRPSTGVWWIFDPITNDYFGVAWGAPGDIPVPANYVGSAGAEIAVFRPSTGAWFLWDLGTSSFTAVALGQPDQ